MQCGHTIVGAGQDPAAVIVGIAAGIGEGIGAGEGRGGDGDDKLGEADHFDGWGLFSSVEDVFFLDGRQLRDDFVVSIDEMRLGDF